MSSTISLLIVMGAVILGITKRCEWFKICGSLTSSSNSNNSQLPTKSASSSVPDTTNITGNCNPNLIKAIGRPNDPGMLLQFNGCITVTGTVVGKAPHYAPDGDMVFAVKLDSQYSHYVNSKNNNTKMQGGIWCEAVCQGPRRSKDSWHQNDCAAGGPFPKFKLPRLGDRLRVTGIHVIDNGEGGHAEIHPVSSIEFLNNSSPPSRQKTSKKKKSHYTTIVRIAI